MGKKKMTSASGRAFEVEYGANKGLFSVSVVVPVYGAEKTIRQAMDSLLDQEMDELEIVVVDDAGDDGSMSVVGGYAALHPEVTVVRHERNAGYGASMNDGIQAARGDWIAILEPDDYVLPGMYRTMMAAAQREGGVDRIDVVKTPYIREVRKAAVERGEGPVDLLQCSYRHRIHPRYQPFDMRDPYAVHLLRHHPSIWSAIYRKAFLDMRGIRFVEYPGAGWADNEFFYETLLRALTIVYVDEPFYVYREETDEEFRSFTEKNPTLAMDRWHSMQDIVERLPYNEGVSRSHISKGFTYLDGLVKTFGPEAAGAERVVEMFERMDPALVKREKLINPLYKQMYAAAMGLVWNFSEDKALHRRALVREAAYATRNNGPAFMAGQVARYLSHNRSKRG